ncbi:flagellar FliJ family protein [Nocardioides ferulae]|uniref:flagellar FliJ family protein n=1 Tax=Nocardioides ferulae TaxID=2340821 RepID=UPI000EB05826|nr:flagellar FliJ family protein [Nocardioides ferulae]
MSRRPDPGLHAVARVRAVRERDSRLGLTQALSEERQGVERVQDLQERLASTPPTPSGERTEFLLAAADRAARAAAVSAARSDLESARLVAMSARERWLADQQRLSAVETLLDRRAQERVHEQRRAEDKAQDETGTNVWRRNQESGS